jgi:hypothetical protein
LRECQRFALNFISELIVHPILDTEYVLEEIDQWLPRLHCIVIGKKALMSRLRPGVDNSFGSAGHIRNKKGTEGQYIYFQVRTSTNIIKEI